MKTIKGKTRKVLLGAATLAAVGIVGGEAFAANTNLQMSAKIIAPVSITKTAILNFGTLTENGAGGTATVDNTGARVVGGGVTGIGGGVTAGGFQLKAAIGFKIDVSMPATATVSNGAVTMKVGAFTIDGGPASTATPFTHVMVAATDTGMKVGGTLTVGAAQATGTYTGTVTLTANYN